MKKPGRAADALWYKDVVVYELHGRASNDGNSDGIGDFPGTAPEARTRIWASHVWLLPFFPSPLKDDGYDISDYMNVHPMYGTMDDFLAFLTATHEQELQVMIEAGDESHVRPASLASASSTGVERISRARLLRLERHRSEISRCQGNLHGY
jgi:hypothetical protein